MNAMPRNALRGALGTLILGLFGTATPAFAQQGWTGYAPAQITAPPPASYTTYPPQGYVWQGYAPGQAWSGPTYAPGSVVVTTVPAQPVAVPGAGWSGYNPSAAWTGYAPAQAWSGYQPGYINAPRSERARYDRRLIGWGWTGGGSYREPSTGRSTPMLKPWLPGAAGS